MDVELKDNGYVSRPAGFLTQLRMGSRWPDAFSYVCTTDTGTVAVFPLVEGKVSKGEPARPTEYAVASWPEGVKPGFETSSEMDFLPCVTDTSHALSLARSLEQGEKAVGPNVSEIKAFWDGCYEEEGEDIFVENSRITSLWDENVGAAEQYKKTSFMMGISADDKKLTACGTWTMFLPSSISRDSVDLPQASFEISFPDHIAFIGFWDKVEESPEYAEDLVNEYAPQVDDIPLGVRNLLAEAQREDKDVSGYKNLLEVVYPDIDEKLFCEPAVSVR